MSSHNNKNSIPLSSKALEMIMQDVLGGLEELALMKAYETSCAMEILAIEMPDIPAAPTASVPHSTDSKPAPIIALEPFRLRKAV